MSGPAPYFAGIAEGPADGQAHWLACDDGLRIRVGHWGRDAPRGTVLLFPGRTEYVEKYGPAAADLRARGYATLAVDWRGQGLADRLLPDPTVGHVGRFPDYQRDVAAALAHARAIGLPEPFFLIGHSMGGAIGLRALMEGLPVRAAVFTGPMWGIRIAPMLRPVAWSLSTLSRPLRFGARFVPGHSALSYVATAPFAGNTLTSDPGMFDFMRRQLAAQPELALGGASLGWLNAALKEMRLLAARPAPPVPALTFLGADEAIVDAPAVHRRMASWPGGALVVIPGARHEVMMETPAIRAQVFDRAAALFGGWAV